MSKTATYSLIQGQTLATATGTIAFTSIPETYNDLILVCNYTTTDAANIYMTLNNDTTSTYYRQWLYGTGSAASAGHGTVAYLNNSATISTTPVNTILNILDYSNATTHKTTLVRHSNASGETLAEVILYPQTTAISSVRIIGTSTFAIGSTFRLYGIEAYK
jgi:hypothetical protein